MKNPLREDEQLSQTYTTRKWLSQDWNMGLTYPTTLFLNSWSPVPQSELEAGFHGQGNVHYQGKPGRGQLLTFPEGHPLSVRRAERLLLPLQSVPNLCEDVMGVEGEVSGMRRVKLLQLTEAVPLHLNSTIEESSLSGILFDANVLSTLRHAYFSTRPGHLELHYLII